MLVRSDYKNADDNRNNKSNYENREKNNFSIDDIANFEINKKSYQVKNNGKEEMTEELSVKLENLIKSFYKFRKILDFDPKLVRNSFL